jgi:kinesin family protein 11
MLIAHRGLASTLDYAFHAKNIKNRPEVNQKLTKKMLIKEYSEEIERLRRDLLANREKSGIYVSHENYEHMTTQIQCQMEALEEKRATLEALKADMDSLQELFHATEAELGGTRTALEETGRALELTQSELDQTQQRLQKTELERDQTEFIAEARAATEDVLRAQASELVQVAETTTEHISGLHAKIARKAHVEQHNLGATESMEAEVASAVDQANQVLHTFTASHSEQTQALVTTVQTMAETMGTELSAMAAAVRIAYRRLF